MSIATVENRGIDKDVFNKIVTVYSRQPCHKSIGLIITYLGKGTAGMKIAPEQQFTTEGGRVHGGIIATLADIAMSAAVSTNGLIYRTAEMKINYLVPVFEEVELIAEAKVVHPGKTIAVVEADLYNNEGKLVAKCMGTYFCDKKATEMIRNGDSIGAVTRV